MSQVTFFSVEKINYHLKRLKDDYKDKKLFSSKIEHLFKIKITNSK